MNPLYKPNMRAVTKKVHQVVNDLYWLVSNSGSVMKCPSTDLGKDTVVVNRNVLNYLTMSEKNHHAYFAFMYKLNEEQEIVVHFKVVLEDTDVSMYPSLLNAMVIGILNSDTLVSDCGFVLNKDNFIKYAGMIGYTDQYDVDSIEDSLFEMMLPDKNVLPSTYEGIRLLETNDFLGEFTTKSKRHLQR